MFKPRRRRLRSSRRRGFSLMIAMSAAFLLVLLAIQTLTAAGYAITQSAQAIGTAQMRATGNAALEEVFGQLEANGSYFDGDNTTPPPVATHPGVGTSGWTQFDSGEPIACTTTGVTGGAPLYGSHPCYTITVAKVDVDTGNNGIVSSRRMLDVEANVRTNCQADGSRCLTDRFQMRVRERSFLDQAWFTQYETSDPVYSNAYDSRAAYTNAVGGVAWATANCNQVASSRPTGCVDVPYTSHDELQGRVFTNDTRILTCGTPKFDNTVAVTGSGPVWQVAPSSSGNCPPSASPSGQPNFVLGASGQVVSAPTLPIPSVGNAISYYTALAPTKYQLDGSSQAVTITVGNKSLSAGQGGSATSLLNSAPLPPNGVLFINGDATVHGYLVGNLTIYATGTVTIDKDLCYADITGAACITDVTKSNSMLGITAGGPIVVTQDAADNFPDRHIDAALFSQQHTLVVKDWNVAQGIGYDPNNPPVLRVRGMVGSYFRPLFAGYDDSGTLVSGYAKSLTYDTRFSNSQPPFFLSPSGSQWQRVDVSELPSQTADLVGSCPKVLNGAVSWDCY